MNTASRCVILLVTILFLWRFYNSVVKYAWERNNIPTRYSQTVAIGYSKRWVVSPLRRGRYNRITDIVVINDEGVILFNTVLPVTFSYVGSDLYDLKVTIGGLIRNKMVVGYKTYRLFNLLQLHHPGFLTRDVSHLCNRFELSPHKQHKFRTVAKEYLNIDMGRNNASEYAIVSLQVLNKYRREWKEFMLNKAKSPLSLSCVWVRSSTSGQASSVSRITIVDEMENVVYDKLFKPEVPVFVAGSKESTLKLAYKLKREIHKIEWLLRKHILVGHNLINGLWQLGLVHPLPLCRDTHRFSMFRHILPRKATVTLERLARLLLKIKVRNEGEDSVQDARLTMLLYKKYRRGWEDDAMTKF